MYNETLKKHFLSEYTTNASTLKMCLSIFNRTSPFEESWGADICTKCGEELREAIEEVVCSSGDGQLAYLSILRDYAKWCISNSVDGSCDGLINVKVSGVDKIRDSKVGSPRGLQNYLNAICFPESEEMSDNVYRCYLWIAYSGIRPDEALNIKSSEVDLVNMVIRHDGKEFPLYAEAIPAFVNCIKLDSFVYKNSNYKTDRVVRKDRAGGDTIVRSFATKSNNISVNSMRATVSRRITECVESGAINKRLSYHDVWVSGMFYMLFQQDSEGEPFSFNDIVELHMLGKNYKNMNDQSIMKKQKQKIARGYKRDYERWKIAFH